MGCALAAIPPPDQISPDTPLRLGIAAALAFPDGSMAAAGLRRELNKLNDSASISAPGN
jgi:hypothetical protein